MIAGCSGGIEPLFAVAFMRRQADMELPDVNPEFVKLAKERGFYSEDLMKKVAEHGSVRDIPEVPEDEGHVARHHLRVARQDAGGVPEVHLDGHLQDHQFAQRGDGRGRRGGLPAGLLPELQGIAVYRDGSRDAQVLSTGKTKPGEKPTMTPASPEAPTAPPVSPPAERPAVLLARRGQERPAQDPHRGDQEDPDRPRLDVRHDERRRVRPGSASSSSASRAGRLRRSPTPRAHDHARPHPRRRAAEVVHQLRGIQDGHPAGVGPSAVLSVPDGVARAMAEHYLVGESLPDTRELPDHRGLPGLRQRPDPPGRLRRLPLLRVLEV